MLGSLCWREALPWRTRSLPILDQANPGSAASFPMASRFHPLQSRASRPSSLGTAIRARTRPVAGCAWTRTTVPPARRCQLEHTGGSTGDGARTRPTTASTASRPLGVLLGASAPSHTVGSLGSVQARSTDHSTTSGRRARSSVARTESGTTSICNRGDRYRKERNSERYGRTPCLPLPRVRSLAAASRHGIMPTRRAMTTT